MSNAPDTGIFVPFEKPHPLLDVDHLKDVVSSKLKDSKELGDLISKQIHDYVDELGLSTDQKASVTDWLQERDGVVRLDQQSLAHQDSDVLVGHLLGGCFGVACLLGGIEVGDR